MAESSFFNKKLSCASCLPCVTTVAHGKLWILLCVFIFVVCSSGARTAYGHVCRVCILCRVSGSQAHGKHGLCRVLGPLPCVAFSAHGKGYICRVPDIWHTAKLTAHGSQRVSGSGCPTPSFHKVISPLQTPTGFLIPLQVTTIQSNCSEVQIVQLVVPFPCYLKIK